MKLFHDTNRLKEFVNTKSDLQSTLQPDINNKHIPKVTRNK